MVEILVAMVLLATGVVFALSAITYATKATTGTTQATQATSLARKILELVMAAGPQAAVQGGAVHPAYRDPGWVWLYGPDGVAPPFSTEDFLATNDPQAVAAFRRDASRFELQVSVQPYRDPSVPGLTLNGLYLVDVRLRWHDRLGLKTLSYPGMYREE